MITKGSKITVIPSQQLSELRLDSLLGKTGYVLENLTGIPRKAKGYMIFIPVPYQEEYLWFIPQESVYEQD